MGKSYFARVLAEHMQENKTTAEDLANATDTTVADVKNWLIDFCEPNMKALKAICDYFKISADELLDTKFTD